MAHHKSREHHRPVAIAAGAVRGAIIGAVIGHEPPLSVDGGTADVIDRRRVSVQWFSGTILTALCGAALMGGAVFTSLDGEANFAALPEQVEVALRGAIGQAGDRLGLIRKGDRLPIAEEPSVARQVIRVSTTSRVGNHEVVRVRPFVRVAGNLSLSATDLSASIPPYNPQRILADSVNDNAENNNAAAAAAPDAEVAFVMRDLPGMLPALKVANLTSNDEIAARVREVASLFSNSSRSLAADASATTGMRLAYAGDAPPDPYKGFEARIIPENVTLLPKTSSAPANGGNAWEEKQVMAKKGDTVTTVLRDQGASPEEIAAIIAALDPRQKDIPFREGQRLRLLMAPSSPTAGARLVPVRIVVATDSNVDAVVALSDTGKYVSVDVRNVDTEMADAADDSDNESDPTGIRLYQSVYETALRNGIPKPLIEELVRIYSYDVDFQRKVQPGDSFEVLYAGEEETPATDTRNEVLFASLTVGGEAKKFYRFQAADDGIVDYYDESGKSAKKFLVRKPVANAIMRGGFGARRHPILGYTKMHTGVDWAAPTGTPIYAAGNGVVEKAEWESGYGKFVLLRHTNGYETAYGHMTAFARNMEVGTPVRQGQVIGFVGSTGLSTGSHVHYEIRINGRFVDPMRIKLPRGRELEGPILTAFDRERDRIDNIIARRPSRVATNDLPQRR